MVGPSGRRRAEDRFELSASSSSDEGSALTSSAAALEPFLNENNLDDQVFSAMSGDGSLKVTVATVRNLVNEMMIWHSMNPVPADALARATTCALLAGNGMQPEQTFQLSVKGDGALRSCMAIASGAGEVRGFVGNPALGGTDGDGCTLPEAVGKGTIQVVKNHPDWPRPYNGITAIEHGDIDRDVGIYLAESEQRSCALAAATSFNGILCTAAGGYLVEQLPGCTDEARSRVERNLAKLVELDGGDELPTNLMLNGQTPTDIAGILLEGMDMQPLGQLKPEAKCGCSEDNLVRSLRLLPKEDVEELLRNQEQVEARCEFCGKIYRMGPDEVEKRFREAKGDPSKDE